MMAKKSEKLVLPNLFGFTLDDVIPVKKDAAEKMCKKAEKKPQKPVSKVKKTVKPRLSPMEKFYKENNNRVIEDDITVASKDFKSYCRILHNALRKEAKERGFDDVTLRPNHYDMSGFFRKGEKYIYWSFSVTRYNEPTNLDGDGCMTGALYRSAKSDKDYTGGINNFCKITELVDKALLLVEKEEKSQAA